MKVGHLIRFNSWGEYIETAGKPANGISPENERASRNLDYSFTDSHSFDEAYKLAKEGWNDGEKQIKELSLPMVETVSAQIERLDVNHDVEGHAIDVARFVDGEPECWLKFENVIAESESGRRLIRLVYNISASAMVLKQIIARKGAAVAALVELLEYAGHRVEVTAAAAMEGYNENLETYIKMKDFDQNLDMSTLAFAFVHPSSLRRVMFSAWETLPRAVRERFGVVPGGGYGRPTTCVTDKGDIYIDRSYGYGGENQWKSPESAEAWVINELKKQGVHLKEKTK